MTDLKISAVYGMEPQREGEYPACFRVGFPIGNEVITSIDRQDEYLGDRSEIWFHAMAGEKRIASMSGRAVSEVHYA